MVRERTAAQLKKLVLIIPAYNEGKVIKHTINSIPKRFQNIVCINDGSIDNTESQLRETRAHVITHPINLGQGAALQTGIEYALLQKDYEYFVTYDADGQHLITDVDKMLETILSTDVDIVLGSRFLGTAIDISWSKKILLKLAIRFSNTTTGLKLTDTHNGLRLMNRAAAQKMQLKMPDFAHASEIIERIAEKKLRYTEIPVTILYTDYSRSKGQAMINAINVSFDILLGKLIKR